MFDNRVSEKKIADIATLVDMEYKVFKQDHSVNEITGASFICDKFTISIGAKWNKPKHVLITLNLSSLSIYPETMQLASKSASGLAKAINKLISDNMESIELNYNRLLKDREYKQHTKDSVDLICDSYGNPNLIRFRDDKAYMDTTSGTIECYGLFTTLTNVRLPTKQMVEVIQFIEELGK